MFCTKKIDYFFLCHSWKLSTLLANCNFEVLNLTCLVLKRKYLSQFEVKNSLLSQTCPHFASSYLDSRSVSTVHFQLICQISRNMRLPRRNRSIVFDLGKKIPWLKTRVSNRLHGAPPAIFSLGSWCRMRRAPLPGCSVSSRRRIGSRTASYGPAPFLHRAAYQTIRVTMFRYQYCQSAISAPPPPTSPSNWRIFESVILGGKENGRVKCKRKIK